MTLSAVIYITPQASQVGPRPFNLDRHQARLMALPMGPPVHYDCDVCDCAPCACRCEDCGHALANCDCEEAPCPPHCCCCGPGDRCCDCGELMPDQAAA